MMYLAIIFCSPLYFAVRKQWGAFTLNLILYGLALLSIPFILLMGIGLPFVFIFWALGVGHAGWHLRRQMMQEHAEMIANKMAEKMYQQKAAGGGPGSST